MKRRNVTIFYFWSCALAWAQFSFQPTTYAVQNAALVTVSADFNHDGNLDLAVANAGSSTVSIFLGNGAGAFGTPTIVPIPGGCLDDSLTAGDFNNDGKVDLLVVCGLQSSIWFLPGLGTGQFGTPVVTALPPGGVVAEGWIFGYISTVAVADFNGDGVLDLVMNIGDVEFGNLDLMLGNGDGTFGAPSVILQNLAGGSVRTADFDGDGKADLVFDQDDQTNPRLTIYRGNGDGTFQDASTFPTSGAVGLGSMTVADVNRDGVPDLVVAAGTATSSGTSLSESATLEIFLGNVDCTFKAGFTANESGAATPGLALADLHGTGTLDLIEEQIPNSGQIVIAGRQHQRYHPCWERRWTVSEPCSAIDASGARSVVVRRGGGRVEGRRFGGSGAHGDESLPPP